MQQSIFIALVLLSTISYSWARPTMPTSFREIHFADQKLTVPHPALSNAKGNQVEAHITNKILIETQRLDRHGFIQDEKHRDMFYAVLDPSKSSVGKNPNAKTSYFQAIQQKDGSLHRDEKAFELKKIEHQGKTLIKDENNVYIRRNMEHSETRKPVYVLERYEKTNGQDLNRPNEYLFFSDRELTEQIDSKDINMFDLMVQSRTPPPLTSYIPNMPNPLSSFSKTISETLHSTKNSIISKLRSLLPWMSPNEKKPDF